MDSTVMACDVLTVILRTEGSEGRRVVEKRQERQGITVATLWPTPCLLHDKDASDGR